MLDRAALYFGKIRYLTRAERQQLDLAYASYLKGSEALSTTPVTFEQILLAFQHIQDSSEILKGIYKPHSQALGEKIRAKKTTLTTTPTLKYLANYFLDNKKFSGMRSLPSAEPRLKNVIHNEYNEEGRYIIKFSDDTVMVLKDLNSASIDKEKECFNEKMKQLELTARTKGEVVWEQTIARRPGEVSSCSSSMFKQNYKVTQEDTATKPRIVVTQAVPPRIS